MQLNNIAYDKKGLISEIALIWTLNDVMEWAYQRETPIKKAEASDVLYILLENHDAEFGVNWETISAAIDFARLERKKEKTHVKRIPRSPRPLP